MKLWLAGDWADFCGSLPFMTIEFSCPYCTVRIRVGDEAAGKQGSCPKCGTKLIVPQLAARPDASAQSAARSQSPRPAISAQSDVADYEQAAVDPSPEGSAAINPLPDAGPEFLPTTVTRTTQRRKRKRRRNSNRIVLIWLACAAAFVGVVVLVVLLQDTQEQQIAGQVTIATVDAVPYGPALITAADVDVSAAQFQQARDRLVREPMLLSSELAQTEFRGTDEGIEIYVRPASKGRLIAVDLRSNGLLHPYLKKQAVSFNRKRIVALSQAATAFVRELALPDPDKNYLERPGYYRNEFALNALRREFGFVCEAIAARQICACVAEKSGDTAWFIVPNGAKGIEFRGRKTEAHGVLFDNALYGTVIEAEAISTEPAEPLASETEEDGTQSGDVSMPSENSTEPEAPAMNGMESDAVPKPQDVN